MLLDIGRDIAEGGYKLGSTEQLEATAERCRELGSRVVTVLCDVRDHEGVDEAVNSAVAEMGKIDVLINNAGISSPTGASHELSVEGWRRVLDINLDGSWHVGRAVARHMVERGEARSSTSLRGPGSRPFRQRGLRRLKHGVVGLTRAMAVDLGPHHIRVNALCPGSVRDDPDLDSRMLSSLADEWQVPQDQYEGLHRVPPSASPGGGARHLARVRLARVGRRPARDRLDHPSGRRNGHPLARASKKRFVSSSAMRTCSWRVST